jgi:hypothetical protein
VSVNVTKYSVTLGWLAADAIAELGAVGVPCWLQDAIVSAASESVTSGATNRGDVSDICLLLRWSTPATPMFAFVGADTIFGCKT